MVDCEMFSAEDFGSGNVVTEFRREFTENRTMEDGHFLRERFESGVILFVHSIRVWTASWLEDFLSA